MASNLGRGKSGVARGLQLQSPEQTAKIGKGRDGQQRGSETRNISDEPSEECSDGHGSRLPSPWMSGLGLCAVASAICLPRHRECNRAAERRVAPRLQKTQHLL